MGTLASIASVLQIPAFFKFLKNLKKAGIILIMDETEYYSKWEGGCQ